ncbi:MAG: AraC family transcriptional regulator [Spirochaetaceae bacterium]|jgi:AraC-like DNA-binding protein|nr:AraC family transcriptional regulator [Spirochaetaceae bacterium]
MEQMPFHQKELVNRSFPFLSMDSPRKPFWFPLHWHNQIEILYVLEGTVQVLINGKTLDGGEGDIFIVDTGLIHGFSDPSPEASVRIFQFGREIFDEPLTLAEDRRPGQPIFGRIPRLSPSVDPALYAPLKDLLMDMDREYQKKEPGYRFAVKSALYKLAALLLRNLPGEGVSPAGRIRNEKNHTRYLEQIFSFVYRHFENPELSLDDAAAAAGLSKYYLTRFLKEQTGLGFHEHLSRARLSRAKEYLTESDTPVIDIACLCGFRSLTTFNRVFREYTGNSPSAFRNGNLAPRKI